MRTCAWLALLTLSPALVKAQEEKRESPADEWTGWLGMMLEYQLQGPYWLWLDTHYNARAFYVARAGLTYQFDPSLSVTLGHAYVRTDPGSGHLTRTEHRPWAQLFVPLRLGRHFSFSQRLRFELRVREKVDGGEIVDGWVDTLRWRSQTGLTYFLPKLGHDQWFAQGALELLVQNTGPNYLDQNRVSLMLGYERRPVTLRLGYMNRFVPGAQGVAPMHEHDVVLWASFRFARLAPKRPPPRRPPSPEVGNP